MVYSVAITAWIHLGDKVYGVYVTYRKGERYKMLMSFDDTMSEIIRIIQDYFGDNIVDFSFCDAEEIRPDGHSAIRFIPFASFAKFETFNCLNESKQKDFVSNSCMVFIFNTFDRNLKELRLTSVDAMIKEKLASRISDITDKDLVVFTLLHEIGHCTHFCKMGKKPSEFNRENFDDCIFEDKANKFALLHFLELKKYYS